MGQNLDNRFASNGPGSYFQSKKEKVDQKESNRKPAVQSYEVDHRQKRQDHEGIRRGRMEACSEVEQQDRPQCD